MTFDPKGQPSAWLTSVTLYFATCPFCGHEDGPFNFAGGLAGLIEDGTINLCGECGKQFFILVGQQGDTRKATADR